MVRDRPKFHTELSTLDVLEGKTVRFETKLTPVNDPEMQVDWLLNGNKVQSGKHFVIISLNYFLYSFNYLGERFNIRNESGIVSLEIENSVVEDTGSYSVKAVNALGTAETSAMLNVHRMRSLHSR
jgi:hypothetical protein